MNLSRKRILWDLTILCVALVLPAMADDAKTEPGRSAGLPVAELKRDTPVDFEKEVLPFLKNNCLACHNTTKAKAGLNLETPQLILQGGDSGPAAVPGKGAESLVFKAATHLDPDLIMPPKDNKANASSLTPEQLALLKLWIDQGARGEVHAAVPVHWLDKPPDFDPIFAVALTQDGQFATCGRGNRIDVYHVPSGQFVTRLADPKLGSAGFTNAAHRDLVNALAFNPDGTLLASAGYREVKLWRRLRDLQKTPPALTSNLSLFTISPDHKWLAATETNNTIALFDLASGQFARTLVGHSNRVASLKFSSNSARLGSGSADKTVRVWNVMDGALVALAETPAAVHAITWTATDKQIASRGADAVVRVWELSVGTNSLSLVKELKCHEGTGTSLDTLPGDELLSGGTDGMVRQWKLAEGKVVRELTNGSPVIALAASPDGKRFASAGTNGIVKLWSGNDGKLVAELKGDRYAYERVAETGRALIVAKSDVEFRKKSLETAEADHKKQTERVAKASETNSITDKIFVEKEKAFKDAQTTKANAEKVLTDLLAEIQKVTEAYENADKAAKGASAKAKAASDKATQAQLAAERATLSKSDAERIAADTASVAARTKVALNNADAAKDTAKRIAEESAAVAEKSKAFADAVVADADMKNKLAAEAKIAAEKSIEEVATLAFAAGQLKPGYDKTLAEAPEKRRQATNQVEATTKGLANAEQEFKRAETRKSVTNHELELALQAQKRAAGVLAEAKTLLSATESAQKKTEASLDDAKTAAAALELPIRALAFSPDGLMLATLGDDRRVHTWSAETGVPFEVFGRSAALTVQGRDKGPSHPETAMTNSPAAQKDLPLPRRGAEDQAEGVISIGFLDNQTLLATGSQWLTAWDLNPAWTLERAIGTGDIDSPLSDRVNVVRFSPDGQMLATGSGEPTRSGEIKLWAVADGKLRREFDNVHSDAVLSLDFSPDGKYLASSSADRFVRVVDLASGKVVKAFEGHTSYVLGVAWKRDSRTLASAGADNVIKVWDFMTGERKKNIDGASKEVTSIAFVGVTDQAVASSGDNQVRMIRDNGEKVRSFEGPTDFMNSVAVTPDGNIVVAGGQDSVLRVWNGNSGERLASLTPGKSQ